MSLSRNEINVAVVGAGHWGKNLIRNFAELDVLTAICDKMPDTRREMASTYPDAWVTGSFDELLASAEINAVAIATPAQTHVPLARKALAEIPHVFVEKPLALSVDQGRELVQMAEELDRTLMVGHLLWYHPAILKLKRLVDGGELGRLQYIYSNRLNLGKIRQSENALWSFAPHDISVILGLLEEVPTEISAKGGNYLNDNIADVTLSIFRFRSGVLAHVFVSWLHPFKEQKLVVVGSEKMAVFDDTEEDNKLLLYPHTIEWKDRVPVAEKALAQGVPLDMQEPLRLECEHFLQCIEASQRPRTDGREGLRVLSVLDACQRRLEGDEAEMDLAAATSRSE